MFGCGSRRPGRNQEAESCRTRSQTVSQRPYAPAIEGSLVETREGRNRWASPVSSPILFDHSGTSVVIFYSIPSKTSSVDAIVKVDTARRIRLPKALDEICPGDSLLVSRCGSSITLEKVDPTMERIHRMSRGRLANWREDEHRSDKEILKLARAERE